jgi:hypothetical protein
MDAERRTAAAIIMLCCREFVVVVENVISKYYNIMLPPLAIVDEQYAGRRSFDSNSSWPSVDPLATDVVGRQNVQDLHRQQHTTQPTTIENHQRQKMTTTWYARLVDASKYSSRTSP